MLIAFGGNLLAGARMALLLPVRKEHFKIRALQTAGLAGSAIAALALHQLALLWEAPHLYLYGPNAALATIASFAALTALLTARMQGFELGTLVTSLLAALTIGLVLAIGLELGIGAAIGFAGLSETMLSQIELWWSTAFAALYLAWWAAMLWRAVRLAGAHRRLLATIGLAVASAATLALVPHQPIVHGADTDWSRINFWAYWKAQSEAQGSRRGDKPKGTDIEGTYARQGLLIDKAIAALKPREAGRANIYVLGAALYASQDVFRRELTGATAVIEEQLGTKGRTLQLVNHRETISGMPLANATNLEAALGGLARVMSPQEDILFLFLTSHGDPGVLQVAFPRFGFNDLTADRLAGLLDSSGLRNRVIVISACYAGSFIPALANEDSLVLTAARADRASFGCSNEREWTYFGDTFFNRAMRSGLPIIPAFQEASRLIAQWEKTQKLTPSEPQMHAGSRILEKLAGAAGEGGTANGAAIPQK